MLLVSLSWRSSWGDNNAEILLPYLREGSVCLLPSSYPRIIVFILGDFLSLVLVALMSVTRRISESTKCSELGSSISPLIFEEMSCPPWESMHQHRTTNQLDLDPIVGCRFVTSSRNITRAPHGRSASMCWCSAPLKDEEAVEGFGWYAHVP